MIWFHAIHATTARTHIHSQSQNEWIECIEAKIKYQMNDSMRWYQCIYICSQTQRIYTFVILFYFILFNFSSHSLFLSFFSFLYIRFKLMHVSTLLFQHFSRDLQIQFFFFGLVAAVIAQNSPLYVVYIWLVLHFCTGVW